MNQSIKIPDLEIAVVHRSDSSGTTFIIETVTDGTLQSRDGSIRVILTNCAPIRERDDQMIGKPGLEGCP